MSSDAAGVVAGEKGKREALVPKLRLPEFADRHLHSTSLGKVTEESTARNTGKLAANLIMGVSKEDGIVPMQSHLIAENISRYKVVRKDWFAYNPMRLNIGSIARWHGENARLVSPDYVVFRCSERQDEPSLLPDYLDHFRRSEQWEGFTNEAGDGGVRKRIYYDDIAQLRFMLPDSDEQQKVADCLTSLDAVIAAEGERLGVLRDHKMGLMQGLFPTDGRTTPRLRFAEFRDTGIWDERPLSSCIELVSGLHLAPDEYSDTGDVPYFSGPSDFTDVSTEIARWTNSVGNVAVQGDILLVVKGSGVGDFCRLAISRVAIGRQLMALRTVTCHQDFLFHLLALKAGQLKARATGNLIPGLSRPDILGLRFHFPPTEGEQRRIAETLTSLDHQLAASVGRVKALRVHKSGLMQQLFPSLSAESA